MSSVDLAVHQNEFLADGATEVHAIVTVTAQGFAQTSTGARSIVIMGDRSGSMDEPLDPNDRHSQRKITAARHALDAAIDQISDGTLFAVIAGNDQAVMLFPPTPNLVVASPASRHSAKEAVKFLSAGGGTSMSTWLWLAKHVFETQPAAVRLGILVTDGKNESESRGQLDAVLRECAPTFQCDCRGVGVNWVVEELRHVAGQMRGEVDMIRTAAGMEADFRNVVERAMGKHVGGVTLRVWTPKAAQTLYVKQVAPAISDLTGAGVAATERVRDYPLGAWGDEERDYHVCVRVPAGTLGDEMLAARVSVLVDGQSVGEGLVRAVWTDDAVLSSRIAPAVAHYTGQADLADAVQAGLAARAAGDTRTATVKLGEAVRLATESGNTGTVRLLEKVVDVDDPKTGTVRLKAAVDKGDEMELDTRSTKTVRVVKGA
jgi:hypothetical protein